MSEIISQTKNKVDVIVVGSGPAGVSAAITLARHGKEVLLVERGNNSGNKNMFGGEIYAAQTADIFPKFWETAPVERSNTEHRYFVLSDYNSTQINYRHESKGAYKSFTVNRTKWDKWCVEEAIKAGVYYAPKTLVKELIVENGKVIGIRTTLESYYANIVILADGVNSLLAKQIGLRNRIMPNAVALGVKEVIKLPSEIIENRFNLEPDTGSSSMLINGPLKNMLGLGFMYTNKNSISIGVGITLSDLKESRKTPYEILDEIKNHPSIAPFLKDGKLLEYSAHLIPEGGYDNIPKLFDDGVMVVGDAAMLVDNFHFEGTNLAMLSGKFAAETAILALDAKDYSASVLIEYEKKLKNSIVIQDLKTYKDVLHLLPSLLKYYPDKICEFMEVFTSSDGIPKREKYNNFVKKFIDGRGGFSGLAGDVMTLGKIAMGVFKK